MLTLKQYSALRRYLGVPLLPHAGSSLLYRDWLLSLHCSQVLHKLKTSLRSALLPTARNTMASADSWPFKHVSLRELLVLKKHPQPTSQVSPGKNDNFHPIYQLHILHKLRAVLDFVLYRKLVRLMQTLMQFLFVRPGLCLRLPSDSQSPTTPLPLANDSYCQVHSGLTPPSYRPCRAHEIKRQGHYWPCRLTFIFN